MAEDPRELHTGERAKIRLKPWQRNGLKHLPLVRLTQTRDRELYRNSFFHRILRVVLKAGVRPRFVGHR